MNEVLRIEKLVHGGQAIGTLADGRRAFVWNALPGELVGIQQTKRKNKFIEAVAVEIIESSPSRISPRDDAYLSTSPWQIMDFAVENEYKQAILQETMQREHVAYDATIAMRSSDQAWQYRNKMEYSFWADDDGLHLALFNRGSHGKRIITGSSIAMPVIDTTANAIVAVLNKHKIRGSQLKTVVVRCNQQGESVAALFVKDESFPDLPELKDLCRGIAVYYSNPKSPASIITRELYRFGDTTLTDTINDSPITYDVNSFFQVNLSVFSLALAEMIQALTGKPFIDMYSGVGTIGLSIGGSAILVESDPHNTAMARRNSEGTSAQVVEATAETALEYIDCAYNLVVDPPRAGLHRKVVEKILDEKPPIVAYLSCNPATQARDLALLQSGYRISSLTGYNFFPRTPHIESLAILKQR